MKCQPSGNEAKDNPTKDFKTVNGTGIVMMMMMMM
jgi:hypothetical protein